MYRRSGPETLGAYVAQYALFHDCRPETMRQYEVSVALFERWAGGPVRLDELDAESVSSWLRDYAASGVAPSTVRSKRSHVLIMWRAAADDGLCELPRRRVRPVRVAWVAPEAWTREDVQRLLTACQGLVRNHPCGLRRSAWWRLAIRMAWDTGLRRGDLWALRADQVPLAGGPFTVRQSKTGTSVVCELSAGTLQLLRESLAEAPRSHVCPWPASHETFEAQFRRIVKAAGLRGTWKWLRRGSGTDCEIQLAGSASEQLGHRPGSPIARMSYVDPTILAAGRPQIRPRPLCEDRGGGGQTEARESRVT